MDRRDDWRDWEGCSCDEPQVATGDWDTETQPRNDAVASDVRASGDQSRIMVIGFHMIRV